jgi:hypothetical protein
MNEAAIRLSNLSALEMLTRVRFDEQVLLLHPVGLALALFRFRKAIQLK